MYTESLKGVVNISWDKGANSISKKAEYKSLLLSETTFLDHLKPTVRHRMFCVKNNIDTASKIPLCYCGKHCKFDIEYHDNGFASFCSSTCSRKNKRTSTDAQLKLMDRDWMMQQRIIKRRSIDDIANELMVSTQPVFDACDVLEIPKIDAKRKSELALLLTNKDWLYDQHVIQHKQCWKIAEEIGSSEPSVSYWLREHDIIANDVNSYDRIFKKRSTGEEELEQYIKSIYSGNVVIGTKKLTDNNTEIDMYLPDKNLAIEFNGTYHHRHRPDQIRECLKKGPEYHISKTEQCLARGVKLIHIWGDQWDFNRNVVKSFIRSQLGTFDVVLNARECEVLPIQNRYIVKSFLNENHLQGTVGTQHRYGLFHEKVLVAVMTFSRPNDVRKDQYRAEWNLNRYCVLGGYRIRGAFSKLLSRFRKDRPGSIITHSATCYSNGNVYITNGFKQISENRFRMWYVEKNTGKRMDRRGHQRKNIAEIGDEKKSERDIMTERGYHMLYDTGTKTWFLS